MTVCLLLAAGSSSRMGKPKMLLLFNGKTLLQHTIDEILKIQHCKPVVVTGCYHSLIKETLQKQQIDFIENGNWIEGMGSSIQKGIQYINRQYPEADNAIITVCDQPYISASLLQQLITVQGQTGKGIVASAYNNTAGTPVLFDKKYFEQLAMLSGQYGARKILQQFSDDTAAVAFEQGALDIDTEEDYNTLLKK